MEYIIRVYYSDLIASADLSQMDTVTIGSDFNDTIHFDAYKLAGSQIVIAKSGNKVKIKGKHLLDCENSRIAFDTIEVGNKYSIDCEPMIFIAVHPKQADGKEAFNIDNIRELTIGRDRTNDIILTNGRTSSEHCKIVKKDGLYRLKDLDSSNGTFVNGKRIREKILNNGDIINISIYQIIFKNNMLLFYNVGNDLTINTISDDESCQEKVCPSGTRSVFEIEKDCESMSSKKGTISVFDMNINVNIDNKEK